jgi:hypothetical protein
MLIVRQPSRAAKRTTSLTTWARCERLFGGHYNVDADNLDPFGGSRVIDMLKSQILEPSTLRQGGDS